MAGKGKAAVASGIRDRPGYAASRRTGVGLCLLLPWLMLAALTAPPARAGDPATLRAGMALKIFPRIVAVDAGVAEKLTHDERLLLVLVFDRDQAAAEQYAERLRTEVAQIRDWPVDIAVADVAELGQADQPPSALLIVEPLPEQLFESLLEFGTEQRRMVFSPFSGDVERGATAGLHIGVRVTPSFNRNTLARSSIDIDPQVLRISKIHD